MNTFFQNNIKLSVIVPTFNEENNIKPFLNRIIPILDNIGSYEIIFCLDPCTDQTETLIEREIHLNDRIGMITFSRRFGQAAATIAGILNCRGNHCVVIDIDLQDPPELILKMYSKIEEGFDVVAARRRTRKGETLLKRITASLGYKLINKLAETPVPKNTGDFRIISRRVIEEMRHLKETHGFLRGLVPLIGFKQTFIDFDRDARASGDGNYNRFFGSIKVGVNGLVCFSNKLLTIASLTGFLITGLSLCLTLALIVTKIFFKQAYPIDFPLTAILILFIGGIQLITIGILGEYIGRIYDEVKARPQYIIDRKVNVDAVSSKITV